LRNAQNYYEAAGILSALKAGVAPATIARPMQPLRIERVAAHVEEANGKTNGHTNGHSNGNGNGNGKGRKKAAVVTSDDVLPEIIGVAGK
jgi:hypothetical protein